MKQNLKNITIIVLIVCSAIFVIVSIFYGIQMRKILSQYQESVDAKRINFVNEENKNQNPKNINAKLLDSLNNQIWTLARAKTSKSKEVLDQAYFNENFIGWVVVATNDGWFMTNSPLSDYKNLVVISNKNEIINIESVYKDPILNIYYLKANKNGLEPIAFADPDDINVGQDAYLIKPNLYNYQNETLFNSVRNLHSRFINNKLDLVHKPDDFILYGLLNSYNDENLPIVNSEAQLMGFSINKNNQSYFVPSRYIRYSIKSFFANNNKVIYPSTGISYIDLSEVVLRDQNLPKKGAYVYSVTKPSEFQKGDVITYIGGDEINEIRQLNTILLDYGPGSKVSATFIRDGKEQKVDITLGQSLIK